MRPHTSLFASESETSHPMFTDALSGHSEEVHPEAEPAPASSEPRSRSRAASPRSKSPGPASPNRGATELYLRELSGSHPLTREGEAEIGRRIELGELACIEAWVQSPFALRELATTAEDVAAGYFSVRDLLLDADVEASVAADAEERLTRLLQRAIVLHSAREAGIERANELAELAQGLSELRLDPAFSDRIERSLRDVAAGDDPATRTSAENSLKTIARARRAVARAKAELVQANLRLVLAVARDHQRFGVPLLDLVQEGNLGLMRAADRFEYRRGHRFGTYAAWWIKQAIKRALLDQGRTIRMPVHLAEARRHVLRARRELVQEFGREPTLEEVAARSGLPIEKVRTLGELALEPLSLDAPVGDGDTRYGDLLPGESPTPADMLTKRRMVEHTHDLLDALTPREREVLRRRYGLDGVEDETLEEIGKSFSLTRERVRQIEAKAIEKLRLRSRERQLGAFLED